MSAGRWCGPLPSGTRIVGSKNSLPHPPIFALPATNPSYLYPPTHPPPSSMQLHRALAGTMAVVALSGASLFARLFSKTPLDSNSPPSLEGLVNQNHRSLRMLADYKTVSIKTHSEGHATDYVSGSLVTTAKKCENPFTRIPTEYFMSQSREDEKLLGWFQTICGGTYLELGGLDGKSYSNSYVFNKGEAYKI